MLTKLKLLASHSSCLVRIHVQVKLKMAVMLIVAHQSGGCVWTTDCLSIHHSDIRELATCEHNGWGRSQTTL